MIGVVINDPGGAELVTSWLKQNKLSFQICFGKYSKNIVKEKFGITKSLDLKKLVLNCEWILCGTSAIPDLEWRAIKFSKKYKKKCVVFLDHWVNYAQRFSKNDEVLLPDEIWVADNEAYKIAKKTFKNLKIRIVENPYFNEIKSRLSLLKTDKKSESLDTILYLCEPLMPPSETKNLAKIKYGYTEEEAIRYFFKNIDYISKNIKKIIIKPHPKENYKKYNWVKNNFDFPIEFYKNKNLLEHIVLCDIVVGCTTMGMVIGLLAKKKVVSCIPPEGKINQLPHKKIIPISHLQKNNK